MIYIDDLMGVQYKTHGRNKYEGFDCFGLLIEAERRLGHDIPEPKAIFKNCNFEKCVCSYSDILPIKKVNCASKEGDIIIIKEKDLATHVGYYMGNGYILHCNKDGVNIIKDKDVSIGSVYTWLT